MRKIRAKTEIDFAKLNKTLGKYWQVFKVSLSEMFIWRANFVLWRVRSVMQLLVVYFIWATVFAGTDRFFGYTQATILTYILGTSLIRSLVLSSRSVDIPGEIHQGILTNYLLKPVSYLFWWFTRDLSDKFVNVFFAVSEITLLILLLKPILFLQTNLFFISGAIIVASFALVLFFLISFLLSILGFWVVEVWAPRFLAMIFIEFLAGGFFPLDILPRSLFLILQATPFPYLIFFPIKIYLGQVSIGQISLGLGVLLGWILLGLVAIQYVWARGLRIYSAEGR